MATNPKQPRQTCKICLKGYTQYPALSRFDNQTQICPDCGLVEAFNTRRLVRSRELGLDFDGYAKIMRGGRDNDTVKAVIKARNAVKFV